MIRLWNIYQQKDPLSAEVALKKAIAKDEGFIEAYGLLSQICYESKRIEEAIFYYSTTLEIDPEGNPDGYRLLAGLVFGPAIMTGPWSCLSTFFLFHLKRSRTWTGRFLMKASCLFAIEAINNPVPFEPENLGDSVNSELNEYWPCLSVDEKQLMFTVMLPLNSDLKDSPLQEDFYISKRSGTALDQKRKCRSTTELPGQRGSTHGNSRWPDALLYGL